MSRVLVEFVDKQGRKWFGAATLTPLHIHSEEECVTREISIEDGRAEYDFRVRKVTVVLDADDT